MFSDGGSGTVPLITRCCYFDSNSWRVVFFLLGPVSWLLCFFVFFVVDIVVVIIIIIIYVIQYLDTSEPSESFVPDCCSNGIRVLFLLNICIGHHSSCHVIRVKYRPIGVSSSIVLGYYRRLLLVLFRRGFLMGSLLFCVFFHCCAFSCNFGRDSVQVRWIDGVIWRVFVEQSSSDQVLWQGSAMIRAATDYSNIPIF